MFCSYDVPRGPSNAEDDTGLTLYIDNHPCTLAARARARRWTSSEVSSPLQATTAAMVPPSCLIAAALLLGAVAVADARLLRQFTYVDLKGASIPGMYSVSDRAEAAAGMQMSTRYSAPNSRIVAAGDGYPSARALSTTHGRLAVSIPSGSHQDANTNLGLETVASQGWWARAVAGSGVSYTAAPSTKSAKTAISSDILAFRPATNKEHGTSTAFTDIAANSAATGNSGTGAAALSWGLETASFSRTSHAEPDWVEHGDRWGHRKLIQRLQQALSSLWS